MIVSLCADHQDALGDACAEGNEFLWFFEKLNHFLQLLVGLIRTGHVGKCDCWLVAG